MGKRHLKLGAILAGVGTTQNGWRDPALPWFREGTADGFNFRVSSRASFNTFVEQVLPILRKRGIFRNEYEAETLRGHLGLPVPTNRHSVAREPGQTGEGAAAAAATAEAEARAGAPRASV
jgi:hypothetical protein